MNYSDRMYGSEFSEKVKLENKKIDLKEAISKHDFSFEMSDDHRWWKAGITSLENIQKLSRGIEPKVIKKIWNKEVTKKYKGNTFKINLETAKEWSQNKEE